jgi:MHS family alpha-ketoglutarate permease-like MFS transporter
VIGVQRKQFDSVVHAPKARPTALLGSIGGSIGNLVEWFDWYVYAAFSLYFARSFFPGQSRTLELMQTAAIFALGFFMRPVGGWLLGNYADRRGRKQALTVSVLVMSLGSFVIAILPGYAQIGMAAPVLLLLMRLLQGLSVGGEYGISATYLSEMAPSGRRGFYSSFQYVTLVGGQLLALAVLLILQFFLTAESLEQWGWRIPFAVGGSLALVALRLRRSLAETEAFKCDKIREGGVLRLLRHHPKEVAIVIGMTMGGTVTFYTFTTYLQKFLVNTAGWRPDNAAILCAVTLCLFLPLQPLFGLLSDHVGRRPLLIGFGLLGSALTFPILTWLSQTNDPLVAAALIMSALLIVRGYTSINAIVKAELFPPALRALGVGLPRAVTVAIFGGTAEFIALWARANGVEDLFFYYVTGCIAVSVITTRWLGKTNLEEASAGTTPAMNPDKRQKTAVFACALLMPAICAGATGDAPPVPPVSIASDSSVEPTYTAYWGVKIPMRDKIALNATVYRPAGQTKKLPIIMAMTPYVSDRFHDVGAYFAQHDYVFAVVDSRGRGNSEGNFDPWFQEGRDGYDAVEWLARQDYADGQVATWGGSYSGKNQWLIASLLPPSLKTIAPASAGLVGYDMGMKRNIPFPYMQRWLTAITGKTANSELFKDNAYWNKHFFELAKGFVPYRAFDELSGNPSPIWKSWVAHPSVDEFWDAATPTNSQFAAITIPVLSITGTYDDAETGTLEFIRRHQVATSERARNATFVVVGPWDHAGSRKPKRTVGGLDFGAASIVDVNALHVAWYDWIMKGRARPSFLRDHFNYYLAGAAKWRSTTSIDAATVRHKCFFLSSPNRSASSLTEKGSIVDRAPQQQPDSYRYDPGEPGRNEGVEGAEAVSPHYLLDDAAVRRINGEGLIYETEALSQPINLVGRPTASLLVALDVPDTDIRVALYEVRGKRSAVFLGQDQIRARYRESPRIAVPVIPGKSELYRFDQFPFIARSIPAGSRIRFVISPLGLSIHQQRNRNSGKVVADETRADNTIATVTLMLGPDGGRIDLPLGE